MTDEVEDCQCDLVGVGDGVEFKPSASCPHHRHLWLESARAVVFDRTEEGDSDD